jgi:1,2-diacylglycerol 3-alpha-glucosyltransferase
MRILIATDSFLPKASGIVRACLNLGEALTRAGHEVATIVPQLPRDVDLRNQRSLRCIEVPSHTFRLAGHRPIVSRASARAAVADLFSTERPDIVHAHTPWAIGQASLHEALRHGVPSVLTVHLMRPNVVNHSFVAGLLPGLTWRLVRRAYEDCGRHSDFVSAPSQFGSEHVRSLVDWSKIGVVSNGVTPLVSDAKIRAGGAHAQLLYVGRLSKEKNVGLLIRAVAARDLREKVRLNVVGSGPQAGALRRLVQRLDAPVDFIGTVDDRTLANLYAAADIFCMPSVTELECIAVLEALSFGLPVVAPRGSALDEIGEAIALYDEPYAVGGLVKTIKSLTTSAGHGYKREMWAHKVAERRSLGAIADQWIEIYTDLHKSAVLSSPSTSDTSENMEGVMWAA